MCSICVFGTFDDKTDAWAHYLFLALIASSTDPELTRHIEYLKAQNKILRARVPDRFRNVSNGDSLGFISPDGSNSAWLIFDPKLP